MNSRWVCPVGLALVLCLLWVEPALAAAISPQQVATHFTAAATGAATAAGLGIAALAAIMLGFGYIGQNPKMVSNAYWGFGGAGICLAFSVVMRIVRGVIQALGGGA